MSTANPALWNHVLTRGAISLSELAHIETKTRPANLDLLRREWDPSKIWPIRLRESEAGVLSIRNGNHRLALARERGDTEIRAMLDLWRGETSE